MFFVVTQNRDILLGRHFYLLTDHANLLWMSQEKSAIVTRWRIELAEYNFSLKHVPGKVLKLPDALSRIFMSTAALNFANMRHDKERNGPNSFGSFKPSSTTRCGKPLA